MATYEMIRCIKCGIEKPEESYYKSTLIEGRKNCCKECWTEYTTGTTREERLATINYQQERAKKYRRERWKNQ